MASVKSVTVYSDVPGLEDSGLRKKRFAIVLTDNNLVDSTIITKPAHVLPEEDGSIFATKALQQQKDSELSNRNIVPEWNDAQADYDRRALGIAMTLTDVHEFYSYLPLFKAMELRGGANRNQRAAYLGVPVSEYTQMEDRFNDVEGIAFFLDNAKDQIWEEILPGWD